MNTTLPDSRKTVVYDTLRGGYGVQLCVRGFYSLYSGGLWADIHPGSVYHSALQADSKPMFLLHLGGSVKIHSIQYFAGVIFHSFPVFLVGHSDTVIPWRFIASAFT